MAISTPLGATLGTAIVGNALGTTPQTCIAAFGVPAGASAIYAWGLSDDGQANHVGAVSSSVDGPFSQVGTAVINGRTGLTMWRLDNPTAGDHDILIAADAAVILSANAVAFYTTGDGLTAEGYSTDAAPSGNVLSADVTPAGAGRLVVGIGFDDTQSSDPAAGETSFLSGVAFGDHRFTASYAADVGATLPVDFTLADSPDQPVMCAVALAPAAGGATHDQATSQGAPGLGFSTDVAATLAASASPGAPTPAVSFASEVASAGETYDHATGQGAPALSLALSASVAPFAWTAAGPAGAAWGEAADAAGNWTDLDNATADWTDL